MSWGGFFYPHQVLVRDLVRAGGMGSSHGAARALAAEVIDTQTLVRDKDGREVVSSTRVTLPLPQHVPLGSLVTVWPGMPQEREARVLAASLSPNDPPLDAYLLLSLE
jgi:hypothetical protein